MRRTIALKLSYYIPVKRTEVTPFSIAEEMRKAVLQAWEKPLRTILGDSPP